MQMTTQTHNSHNSHGRRARAVYASQRRCGPVAGLVATQLGILAVLTLAIACVVGLRAWLSL
jgi:hypothetical protein